jgi:hypothetical protein
MKTNASYATVIYWIATVAATVTLTTHVSQWNRYRNEIPKPIVPAGNNVSQALPGQANPAMSAPYRDGLFMGKLTLQRGEEHRPAVGRWATTADQDAFSAGYDQANTRTASIFDGN